MIATSGSRARLALVVGGVALVALAVRFWLHDAFPYLADYSETSYRRYWPLRFGLIPHIAGGTIALFAGPFQVWSGLRRRFPRAHRWTGYAYVSGVALSAVSSFSLVFHTLPDFGLSLFILALVWLATIAMALAAVRNGRIDAHQEWMIRSYIVTFAFVGYRFLVGLPVFAGLGSGRFATVLWISWVVPMMVFEVSAQWSRVRRPKRQAAVSRPYVA